MPMKLLDRWNLHPFFFAAYPVLAVLAYNIEEVYTQAALRSLLVALLLGGLLYALLARLLHDRPRAAVLVTTLLIFFFLYGQLYNELRLLPGIGQLLGRHRVLAPLWLVLILAAGWKIVRRKGDWTTATRLLNTMGLLLVVFSLANLGLYAAQSATAGQPSVAPVAAVGDLRLPAGETPPDIYYIILDAYTRDDTLQEHYDLDNTAFLKALEGMGFYVAYCSQSNYAQTRLSLASSLNLNYLPALSDEFKPGNTSRVGVRKLLQSNDVRHTLEGLGYTTVAFSTGFESTEWEDAGMYLTPGGNGLGDNPLLGGVSAFEKVLLSTTYFRVVMDGASSLPAAWQASLNHPLQVHRRLLEYNLDQLSRLPEVPGPKFVFAHLVIPHPPYVFGPQGEVIDRDLPDTPGYQDQIRYLDQIMPGLLQKIIQDSAVPPIIILQGDHGAINAPPALRLNILNAYYLPGNAQKLYPRISPVNTFRLIFNLYFGGHYEQLDDTAYFSYYNRPYEFIQEKETRPGCK